MFFYTALFVASVISSLIILYLFRALKGAGKAVYSAILPSAKRAPTSQVPEDKLTTTVNGTLTPWGWKSTSVSAKPETRKPSLARSQTPWGWKGNHHKTRGHTHKGAETQKAVKGIDTSFGNGSHASMSSKDQQPTVGWPYREEQFEFAGKAYKVTRKAKPARTNLRDTGKPWGW